MSRNESRPDDLKAVRRVLKVSSRLLIHALYSVLMLIVVVTLYLLLTQNGLHLILSTAQHYLPEQLTVEASRGRLYDRLVLEKVNLSLENMQFQADEIVLDWRFWRLFLGSLSIREVTLKGAELTLHAQKERESERTAPALDLSMLNQIRMRWPFSVEVERFDASESLLQTSDQRYHIERFALGTQLSDGKLLFHTESLQAIGAELEGEVAISGSRKKGLYFEGDLQWHYQGWSHPLAGSLQLKGGFDQLQLHHTLREPEQISSHLTLHLLSATPSLKSVHHFQRIAWPPQSTQLLFKEGALHLNAEMGKQLTFDTQLSTQIEEGEGETLFGMPIEQLKTVIESRGELDERFSNFTLNTRYQLSPNESADLPPLVGEIELEGAWQHFLFQAALDQPAQLSLEGEVQGESNFWRLQGELDLKPWNPATLFSQWPGELEARVAFETQFGGGSTQANLLIHSLDGEIKGEAISGKGSLKLLNEQFYAEQFSLQLLGSELTLKGEMGSDDSTALHFLFSVPDWSRFHPTLGGTGSVTGTLSGSILTPQFQIKAEAEELETPIERWPTVAATLSGSLNQHQLALHLQGETELTLSLEGAWRETLWRGELHQLTLNQSDLGSWELKESVQLTLTQAQLWQIEPLCLTDQKNRLCLKGDGRAAEEVKAEVEVEWNDFRPLRAWMPPQLRLNLPLRAEGEVVYSATSGVAGNLRLHSEAGHLRWFSEDAPPLKVPLQLESLSLKLVDEQIEGAYRLNLMEYGESSGSWALSYQHGEINPLKAIDLRLEGSLVRFDPLNHLVPHLDNLQGELGWRLNVQGEGDSPQWQGELLFSQGVFSLPELGRFDLPFQLKGEFEGDQMQFRGHIKPQDSGELALQSRLRLTTVRDWEVEGELVGENFLLSDSAQYYLIASPEIRFKARPEQMSVVGRVVLPEGHLHLRELPSGGGIRVSSDVVVVSDTDEAPPLPFNLLSDLRLKLGDRIFFKGMGLDGRLQGEVRYFRRENGIQEIFGEMGVREGKYRAFGYNLDIERGSVIFAGSPRNPGLEISAERKLLSGEAIPVLISGTLQEPVLTLPQSSDDAQGDGFAKLLTGHSVGEGSGEGVVTEQVAMMSVGLTEGVTQSLAQSLGFDSGGLRTDGDLESTSLFLGKQVTDRLFVGYGIGLVTPEQSVNLRFKLTPNWSIEGNSGRESSVDLIFNYETQAPITLLPLLRKEEEAEAELSPDSSPE